MSTPAFRTWIGCINALSILFVLAPIVIVVASSFGETEYLRFPPKGFTWRWYAEALGNEGYWETAATSLWLGLWAAALAVLAGTLAAWALARGRVPGGLFLEGVFLSPLMLPNLVLGVAVIIATHPLQLSASFWRLALVHVVVTTPYVIRIMLPVIATLDRALEDAAADLGASPPVVLRTVTLPLLMPPILLSLIVAFMVSFDELVLGLFLAPVASPTLPMRIFANVEFELDPTVGAISSMLIGLTAVLMLVVAVISRKRA